MLIQNHLTVFVIVGLVYIDKGDKMKKNILVKLSGDTIDISDELFSFLQDKSKEGFVVLIIGGGTQINEAFDKVGFQKNFGVAGRETKTLEERQLARDVLEKNQSIVQDYLSSRGLILYTEIPVIHSGTILCHVNGDEYVKAVYNGYDEIFVVTTKERLEKKIIKFLKYKKIIVKAF